MKSKLLRTKLLASFILMSIGITHANAQLGPGPFIKIPFAPPDLVVTVDAPAQLQQTGQAWVEVTVDNTLTAVKSTPFGTILGGSAVAGVFVKLILTGLEALSVQGDSGLQCGVVGGAPSPIVMCDAGAIPAGGRATISVLVKERGNCRIDCGPVYTDAMVDPGNAISERLETNNRALNVTDTVGCIN